MKIMAVLLAFVIVVPAMVVACHCCPVAERDSSPMIQNALDHSCCGASELTLNHNTLTEKTAFAAVSSAAAAFLHRAAPEIRIPEFTGAIDLSASPHSTLPALSSVLRI